MLETIKRRLLPYYARWRDAEARAGRLPDMLADCASKRADEAVRNSQSQEKITHLEADVVRLRQRLSVSDGENASLRLHLRRCKKCVDHMSSVVNGGEE